MTWPLGKLGSLITRVTVTSSAVGRGRLMRRLTIQLRMLEELESKIKMASSRKRNAQNIPAMLIVSGTPTLGKPGSEIAIIGLRIKGWCCFWSVRVIDL